jgi:pyruvate formate lyase activating enzyme
MIRESPLYEKIGESVKCGVCERRCVITRNKTGFCKSKKNISGKLCTLVYGDISAVESRPIEIKPFFHFFPGSTALTFSSWGCNFRCPWCQNWHLSRGWADPEKASYISPEKMVDMAIRHGDLGLCVSFQEPTLLFEYSLDAFKLANEKNLYNCFVSNGYLTIEALSMLRDAGMHAINIDIKGDEYVYKKYCKGIDVDIIWRNAREAKNLGMHVEMINLVITGVNDDEECLDWIIEKHLAEVGQNTPLHFTRYHPAYKFTNPPTKVETLEMAYKKAKREGILYPYIGNVPGHEYENTYCPTCGEKLIKRLNYSIISYRITEDKRCPKCKEAIPIIENRKSI